MELSVSSRGSHEEKKSEQTKEEETGLKPVLVYGSVHFLQSPQPSSSPCAWPLPLLLLLLPRPLSDSCSGRPAGVRSTLYRQPRKTTRRELPSAYRNSRDTDGYRYLIVLYRWYGDPNAAVRIGCSCTSATAADCYQPVYATVWYVVKKSLL